MAKFKITIVATVEAPSAAHAAADAQKIKTELENPLVKMILSGKGVSLQGFTIDPTVKSA